MNYDLSHLRSLESEAIHVLREVAAEFRNPVLLYSVGKDSSVLVRLVQKAFHPGPIPFPLLHVDTGYKFPEMYEFRDRFCRDVGARLIVERNEAWITKGAHPHHLGVEACCSHLKTEGLLDALRKHGFDAAIGGARREEEKSRAKERVFSVRDGHGQWDPKNQRPELWDLYNTRISEGESVRAFPLSNWTELDVWRYIQAENIPVVPLYFAKPRPVIRRNGILVPQYPAGRTAAFPGAELRGVRAPAERREMPSGDRRVAPTATAADVAQVETVSCRFRSLGCVPCTGAVESSADTLDKVIAELGAARASERENRIIDLTGDSSMEQKKREGYF
jgi:sulfate adenylyltransferase subunit 2